MVTESTKVVSKREMASRRRLADEMERRSGGELVVSFEPETYRDSDPACRGHIFIAYLNAERNEDMADSIFVDDRQGDLPALIAAECRRIASLYQAIARKMEGGK